MKKLALLISLVALASCSEKKETTTHTSEVAVSDTAAVLPPLATQPATAAPAAPAQAGPTTSLALSEPHHDFGEVKKGEKVSHTYTVTNTGQSPLIISEVRPGCGCTAPEFTREPIMPGKEGKVTLEFDSSSFDGMVSKEADVFANVAKSPIRLTFNAIVVK